MERTTDRVRANTAPDVNAQLDREAEQRVCFYATQPPEVISRRIGELDREWDMERVLETNASILGLVGLSLGVAVSKKLLLVPGVVLAFLFQHAVQGWCPPVPVFRRLGIRTRREIDAEKYALKALRGDFRAVDRANGRDGGAVEAVRAARDGS